MSSRARRVLATVALSLIGVGLAAVPASAQIYALRDENGVLTLSDKPLGAGAQTFASRAVSTSGSGSLRTARVVSESGVRSSQWDDVIDHHAREQGVRPDLVRAVIQVESAFNPRARSVKGAMGLMQLMPGTARDLGVRNAYDPLENIRGGVTYLRSLLDEFGGSEELALAAYNAGPHRVKQYGGTIPPYRETRDYVSKITGKVGAGGARTVIYRITELVDGEEVVRYSNQRPPRGTAYEVVGGRRAVE
jgi:soluble lytic murein transglycosylase-like protein